jgi:DnaJ-class molecular chaperone
MKPSKYAGLEEVLARLCVHVLDRCARQYLKEAKTAAVEPPVPSPPPPRPTTPDPFRVLGLKTNCTVTDVRRRVRDLAKLFHPDLATGDADKMAEINTAAQEIIAGLEKRA